MAQTLPGVPFKDLSQFVLTLDGPSFEQILTDTLGNHGTPGDALEIASGQLSDLMDAFTADVDSTADLWSQLPSDSLFHGTVTALTLLAAEMDADQTLGTIGSGLDSLAIGFGVWGIFDTLVQDIQAALYNLYNDVIGLFQSLFNQINFINPGQFGGGL